MDPLSITASAIAAVQISLEVSKYFIDVSLPNQFSSLKRSYGPTIAVLVTLLLRDTATQYERVESVVLPGENDDVLAFRQAVTDECNMTAVAVGQSRVDWNSKADVNRRALSLPKLP